METSLRPAHSTTVPDRATAGTAPGLAEPIPFARTEICPEARSAALRVLASGWVTTGEEAAAFESEFAARVRARYAVAVSSCTAALELSLRALRLPRRALVLVPDLTFCGAAQAVLHAGLRPVLVDVDPATGMPDAETTARAARSHGRPAAMVALHFGGAPAPLAELADAAGLPMARVVEDAAHGLGTEIGSRPVGALSRATCFSFYATKNLPIGEGGMVTTDDAELADRIRRASLHGMSADAWRRHRLGSSWHYAVEDDGLKANMTDLQAAIGRAQLGRLDGWQRRRAELAARYTERVRRLPGLLPPSAPAPGTGKHAWHLYVVRVLPSHLPGRDELVARLAERGIGSSVHFIPLHRLGYFQSTALRPLGGLTGAALLYPQLLSLPLHPGLTDAQVDRVCEALEEIARRSPTGG